MSGAEPAQNADAFINAEASIIVAVGGNLAAGGLEVISLLQAALAALPGEGVRVVRRSRFWRSAAWPNASDPAFLNAVVLVATDGDPEQTLAALHRVEARFGRVRHSPNAPRTVDLDLVAYGRQVRLESPILPHPRAADRRFVMGPLAEIAPHWRHPISGIAAFELARRARVGRDATPIDVQEVCKAP